MFHRFIHILHQLRKIFVIILSLIGFLTFGQENKIDRIDNEVNSINSDSTLTKSKFDLNKISDLKTPKSGILKVWHNNNKIFKIIEENDVDYGNITSTIYMNGVNPIKIIETENVWTFLNDSISEVRGYGVDLIEEFKVTSYIIDWNKKERKLIIAGSPLEEKNISYEFNKYYVIIRKAKNVIKE